MSIPNDLDCKIYFDASNGPDLILAILQAGDFFRGLFSFSGHFGTLQSRFGEMDVQVNEDADERKAASFPDGFLHFAQVLEFYPRQDVPFEERKTLMSALLRGLWAKSVPAVAACDYENELPENGGCNNVSLPWPGRTGVNASLPDNVPLGESISPTIHP